MKIRKLHLKNIGPFADAELEFPPGPAGLAEIHILTGQNGSGKTTLLMALASAFDDSGVEVNPQELAKSVYWKGFVEVVAHFALSNSFQKRFRETSSEVQIYSDTEYFTRISNVGLGVALVIEQVPLVYGYSRLISSNKVPSSEEYEFAVFAFSGYRQMQSERVEAIKEPQDFNPLNQSLEFVKDYSQASQISINQLIANNFSKKWIESTRNPKKSEKFAKVLSSIEKAIFDITGWKIEFDLQTEPINLVVKLNGEELEFDVLPDGLRSLISWMADLLGRVDLLKWADDAPITEKKLILLLDEIEVHLHPAWQRKVLPVVQKLFKNAQIFVSTHSPFVVNSVDDAWVYKLQIDSKGKATVAGVERSENSNSITQVLRETFDIKEWFGLDVQNKLDRFEQLRDKILENGGNKKDEKELLCLANSLAQEPSDQLKQIIRRELATLSEAKGKDFSL